MTVSDLQFTGADEPQVENYRPLCGLAVTAFLCGIGSALAVFTTYLLLLPPAGVVLSIAALRRIRASGDVLSGRRLAIAALVLSCFFGSWAVVQYLGRPSVIASQARHFGDGWLQLIMDGNTSEAYQWTLPPENRLGQNVSPDAFYKLNAEAAKARDNYFLGLPFQADAQGSSIKSFRFLGNDSVAKGGAGEDLVVHRYEVIHEKKGEEKTDILLLTIARFPPDKTGFVHWQVRQVGVHDLVYTPM